MKIKFLSGRDTGWFGIILIVGLIVIVISCSNEKQTSEAGITSTPDSTPVLAAAAAPKDLLKIDCDWVDSLASDYEDSLVAMAGRNKAFYIEEAPKRFPHLTEDWKERPVNPLVADAYMNSYRRSLSTAVGTGNTRTVILSVKELAFYLNYLYKNRLDSIQFSFARLDLAALTADELTHRDLEQHTDRNNKYTLITGLPMLKADRRVTRYSKPFRVPNTLGLKDLPDTVDVYDDWHEIWP